MARKPLLLISYLALVVVLIAAATRARTSPGQSIGLVVASVVTAFMVTKLFRHR